MTSAVEAELRALGNAISDLRERRDICDADGIGADVRRVGAAAAIFHLRCMVLGTDLISDKDAALEGMTEQLAAVESAILRLRKTKNSMPLAPTIEQIERTAAAVIVAARNKMQSTQQTD